MTKIVKRGFYESDKKEFNDKSIEKLYKAAKDIYYLINHGYNIKPASTFVGNHYLLSERQRLSLARAISPAIQIENRKKKEIVEIPKDSTLHIDGFNTIITLEVALSNSLLLKCMDKTIRDLAALRGTYRLIDKTDIAIKLIGDYFNENQIKKAIFYLDSPVSNSGRLSERILTLLDDYDFEVETKVITNVDSTLEKLDNVVTSDAIILDKCISYINITSKIIDKYNEDFDVDKITYVDFSNIL